MVKNPPANAGDMCLIPGLGRSPEEGNGNPSSILDLKNPMDIGTWKATVHRVAESWMRLSDFNFTFILCGSYSGNRHMGFAGLDRCGFCRIVQASVLYASMHHSHQSLYALYPLALGQSRTSRNAEHPGKHGRMQS